MARKIQLCLLLTVFFALFSKFDVLYSSSHLNYGLYWLCYYNNSQKHNLEVYNSNYNPDRPTVIYFHGWKKGFHQFQHHA